MKISVITMQNVYNYGSALQSYATEKYFADKGYEVEFVNYYPNQMKRYGSVRQIYTDALAFHKNKIKSLIIAFCKYPSVKVLKKSFKPFSRKYFKLSEKFESKQAILNNPPQADIYCTGSDQVWNNTWDKNFDGAYFLDFAPKNKKKIAFSASFGRDDIPQEELAPVKDLLEEYSAISVREESGIEILRNIKNPVKACVLDPTFMLTRHEWLKLSCPVRKKGYILVYKLHEDSITSEIAAEIAKKTGKQVIRLSTDYLKRINCGKTIMAPKVEEFISYIANADLVVTDSFHATAFSINLNVPFISVKWRMFNDRIDTILKTTELQQRGVSNIEQALEVFANPIDFERVNRLIEDERKKTDEFMIAALRGETNETVRTV